MIIKQTMAILYKYHLHEVIALYKNVPAYELPAQYNALYYLGQALYFGYTILLTPKLPLYIQA